jgi:copper resistance protein B
MAPPQEQRKDKPKEPIAAVTDADRAAAFPQGLEGHAVHDRPINWFVQFDQLEWQGGDSGGFNLENTSWIGGDINRLWIRAEGESEDDAVESALVHAMWGRSFSRWWDFVAGVRQDFRPGDAQTWAAFGLQGLAPYWFEIEATGYVGAGGRTHARIEAEYDLLLTNRLALQPLGELEIYGKSDPERGLGAGLSSVEAGLRLRYEIRREFAPYVGLTWDRKLFGTADYAREEGEKVGATRVTFGVRTWF